LVSSGSRPVWTGPLRSTLFLVFSIRPGDPFTARRRAYTLDHPDTYTLFFKVQFRIFIQRVAEQLGEAQLPLNPDWQRACDAVRADAVHYPLMKNIVCALYKRNGCSNPRDAISIESVLDYLGQLHYDLKQQNGHDLDALRLIDRIGEISVSLFRFEAPGPGPGRPGNTPPETRQGSLEAARRNSG
jgi:hypothetical protein